MSLARTRIAARLLVVAALAALTAGCFQPMYAAHTDGSPDLREKLMGVEVPPLNVPNGSREARLGVEIRNALAFKMYGTATGMAADPPAGDPDPDQPFLADGRSRHRTADQRELRHRLPIQPDRIASNKSVMNGTTFARVSYDTFQGSMQRFARSRAFRDAEDRASQEIAENIQTRLASFFIAGS